MIKILLIFVLFIILYRVVGFFLRLLIGSSASTQQRQQQQHPFNRYSRHQDNDRKPRDGNVNIDYIPDDRSKKDSSKGYDGGDYIDYEEVK